jgi:hypothetical protein
LLLFALLLLLALRLLVGLALLVALLALLLALLLCLLRTLLLLACLFLLLRGLLVACGGVTQGALAYGLIVLPLLAVRLAYLLALQALLLLLQPLLVAPGLLYRIVALWPDSLWVGIATLPLRLLTQGTLAYGLLLWRALYGALLVAFAAQAVLIIGCRAVVLNLWRSALDSSRRSGGRHNLRRC